MKKHSKVPTKRSVKPEFTVGLDLGDKSSHYCILNPDGELMEEGKVRSTEAGLRKQFGDEPRMRIGLEAGTHSAWVDRLLTGLGHEVIVANPRKVRAITANESKNDRNDAVMLARLASCDPKLLSPIQHRGVERQQDLNLIRTRAALVRARTMLINAVRGLVKSGGGRLASCSSDSFADKARASVPPELRAACDPLLEQIAQMKLSIRAMDKQIEGLEKKYPEIAVLRTVPGVGPLVAACYVLTMDSPHILHTNRQAGAFLGLRPRQSQSGASDPQNRISRTGNTYLRSLLVQSAQHVLGPFGPPSALRQWGLQLAGSGGKSSKRRAIVAVARKLAVMLYSMWRSGSKFQPFPQGSIQTAVPVAA
jgi:transposase